MICYEDPIVSQQMTNTVSKQANKHLKQIASMVSHIKNLHVPDESTCFIELGAGRGKLTYYLSQAVGHAEKIKYLLIERGSQRHKFDSFHRTNFERIRMDIKNLNLGQLTSLKTSDSAIIYGKHLCGSAIDLTLHCLKRTLKPKEKFKGLLLAVCCHHLCDWSSFCGKNFFKNLNLSISDFYVIRNLTSWATDAQYELNEGDDHVFKKRIGRICKNLIDTARIAYITDSTGFQTKFFNYCDISVTLENRMLIVNPIPDCEIPLLYPKD